MSRKKTHEQYVAEVAAVNANIEVVGIYSKASVNIEHQCKACGHSWSPRPTNVLKGQGCPTCFRQKVKKTHREYVAELLDANPNITAVGVYSGAHTLIEHQCKICSHVWLASPTNVLKGRGCPKCKAAVTKARHGSSRAAFVGQITPDGHLILEHIGYYQTPAAKKRGECGSSQYRYKCGNCGQIGEALGGNLKKPGHITGCSHCSKSQRESIHTLRKQPKRANSLAMFYVVPVWYDQFIKIGITKNFKRRSACHEVVYDGAYFVSHLMPRAWVYVAEQIILNETLQWQPGPLPKEMIETYWPGTSELRDWRLDPDGIIDRFHQIIDEIKSKDGDWYAVYKANFTKGGQS